MDCCCFRLSTSLASTRSLGLGLAAVVCFGFIGCGGSATPDLASVSGTVTLDGQPLPGALVTFQPQFEPVMDDEGNVIEEPGKASSAETDSSGAYVLLYNADTNGACIAKHLVTITTRRATDGAADSEEESDVAPEKVPNVYNSDSNLLRDVVAGDNVIDFSLESSAGEIPVPDEAVPDEESGDDGGGYDSQ